jgi:hypothetical protein
MDPGGSSDDSSGDEKVEGVLGRARKREGLVDTAFMAGRRR